MQWIARSLKYDEPLEDGSIFELKGNKLKIVIHHHRYYSEKEWLLSCAVLGIDKVELGEVPFDEAVERTKQIIKKRIEFLQDEAFKFVLDGTEIERVRY